jgi:hypothetical protein
MGELLDLRKLTKDWIEGRKAAARERGVPETLLELGGEYFCGTQLYPTADGRWAYHSAGDGSIMAIATEDEWVDALTAVPPFDKTALYEAYRKIWGHPRYSEDFIRFHNGNMTHYGELPIGGVCLMGNNGKFKWVRKDLAVSPSGKTSPNWTTKTVVGHVKIRLHLDGTARIQGDMLEETREFLDEAGIPVVDDVRPHDQRTYHSAAVDAIFEEFEERS